MTAHSRERMAVEGVLPAHQTDEAFAQAFHEHVNYVWRVLRRLGVSESDVEDVCQEVFIVVHRRLGDFEGRSKLRTWIYGICVKTASDYRRRAFRRREIVTEIPPDHGVEPRQIRKVEEREVRALLDSLLDELDETKRAVFVLFKIEELPMDEVAEAVGCPLKTAYSRFYAARKELETVLRNRRRGGGA